MDKISKSQHQAAMAANDAEDAAANERIRQRVNDPQWRADFLKLRPDLTEADLPPIEP